MITINTKVVLTTNYSEGVQSAVEMELNEKNWTGYRDENMGYDKLVRTKKWEKNPSL